MDCPTVVKFVGPDFVKTSDDVCVTFTVDPASGEVTAMVWPPLVYRNEAVARLTTLPAFSSACVGVAVAVQLKLALGARLAGCAEQFTEPARGSFTVIGWTDFTIVVLPELVTAKVYVIVSVVAETVVGLAVLTMLSAGCPVCGTAALSWLDVVPLDEAVAMLITVPAEKSATVTV